MAAVVGPKGSDHRGPTVQNFCHQKNAGVGINERKELHVTLHQFLRDEEGQGLVEYALIIAVIAIAVIVAMVFLRGQIENIFSNIGNNLT